jgi:hypothetical protein
MAFDDGTRFAAGLQLRWRRPWRSLGWIAARFAWAVLTLLVITSPRVAVRAEAEVVDANKVPIEIIRFDRGASGKDISGAVLRGERSLYSIDARSGQRLSVSVSAEEDNAVFQIYGPGARAERRDYGVEIVGAKALPGAGEGEDAKEWSGVLPETGTYLVAVGPTRGNATYTLRVAIH